MRRHLAAGKRAMNDDASLLDRWTIFERNSCYHYWNSEGVGMITYKDQHVEFHSRLTSIFLIVTYAIFAGLSFPFFHDIIVNEINKKDYNYIIGISIFDSLYIALTLLLIVLLIYQLAHVITNYESALARSETRFRGLVESITDIIWEIDKSYCYTFVSPNVFEVLGFRHDELLGKPVFSIIHPSDRGRMEDLYSQCSDAPRPFHQIELNFLHRDGHFVTTESSGIPILDRDGKCQGFRGIDRDISQRRQAERAFEQTNAFYRSLFDEFPLPIWRSRADGFISYYNTAAEKFLGLPLEESGWSIGNIHPDDIDHYMLTYMQATQDHVPFTLTFRLLHIDGTYRQVKYIGQPRFDPVSGFIGFIGYFQEIARVNMTNKV
jgi:PAS domain S-box-containing protein